MFDHFYLYLSPFFLFTSFIISSMYASVKCLAKEAREVDEIHEGEDPIDFFGGVYRDERKWDSHYICESDTGSGKTGSYKRPGVRCCDVYETSRDLNKTLLISTSILGSNSNDFLPTLL